MEMLIGRIPLMLMRMLLGIQLVQLLRILFNCCAAEAAGDSFDPRAHGTDPSTVYSMPVRLVLLIQMLPGMTLEMLFAEIHVLLVMRGWFNPPINIWTS
jgi:hypothetical protein